MTRLLKFVFPSLLLLATVSSAQIDRFGIAAGTPEDKALQAISNEADAGKKLTLYQEFVERFAANPEAAAYGNWQLSQAYQAASDLPKALEAGEKALAGSPRNLEVLVSQTGIAQQIKNNAKVIEYATRGGEAYNSLSKQPKPDGLSETDFKTRMEQDLDSGKSSYEFLESSALNAIVDEKNAKTRMGYIERFTPAFPSSRFEDQVTQYAMFSLGEMNEPARLFVYGEKALAANPSSLAVNLMMANAYVDDNRPGSTAKAVTYAQKVVAIAKADAPDADSARKLSAGVAHSTLGYAYMKQEKTAASVPELQAASALLKGQDSVAYATALYRLGFAYAKLSKTTEARTVLTEAAAIPGPLQQTCRDLLAKVNSARAKGK